MKRFVIDNNIELENKVETYELSCIVDNDTKNFYFIVDSLANVESLIERLNALEEENKQLKKRNRKLVDNLQFYMELSILRGL